MVRFLLLGYYSDSQVVADYTQKDGSSGLASKDNLAHLTHDENHFLHHYSDGDYHCHDCTHYRYLRSDYRSRMNALKNGS